jgi:hypothetical protein
MRRIFPALAIVLCLFVPSFSAPNPKPQTGHYLFVWAGDRAQQAKDFLAVIDADPSSPNYGHLLTTFAPDQTTIRPHHTEYTMHRSKKSVWYNPPVENSARTQRLL